jgi:hypothetical protein
LHLEQIVDQVQQRIFAAHAKEYQRNKAAGRMAWATPKNILAFGYRLVRFLRSPVARATLMSVLADDAKETGPHAQQEQPRPIFHAGLSEHHRRVARHFARLERARIAVWRSFPSLSFGR